MNPQVRQTLAQASGREMIINVAQNRVSDTLTALASGVALIVSGFSLWETTFRQPELQLYIGDNLGYTRDPWAGEDVFVVPITVANGGARDGAVISFDLTVRNLATGTSERYQSSYVADASYFGATDDVTASRHRPKTPFAPVVVSGRTSYSGTVLFYPKAAGEKPRVEPNSDLELTLAVVTPSPSNWVDQQLAAIPQPVTETVSVPSFLPGALLTGELAHLRPKPAAAAK